MSSKPRLSAPLLLAGIGLALGVAIMFVFWRPWSGRALPGPGDPTYEATTRAFYHGLAALEVGLLDDARQQFTRATELSDREPASWVNLGVTQLRLGELDAAAGPIQRARELAPDDSAVALVAGRMEIARGRIDEGVVLLRRAVELDPNALRARYALADEIARSGAPDADARAQEIFDELTQRVPTNIAVLIERGRVAARLGDAERLRDVVMRLEAPAAAWPPAVREQYDGLTRAVADGNFEAAARALVPLRNVLASVTAFREDLAEVQTPTELIAEPIPTFIAMVPASATPSPPDGALAYRTEPLGVQASPDVLLAFPQSVDGPTAILGADSARVFRLDAADSSPSGPFPSGALPRAAPSAQGLLALDWNHDFRADVVLAGRGGLHLLLQQEDGSFRDTTAQASGGAPVACDCFGAWAADIEMDGDLDIVAAPMSGAPIVLRNNGNGTWRELAAFSGVTAVRGFAWADLDRDADPDAAFLDDGGALHVFTNRQAGSFAREAAAAIAPAAAISVADLNADGAFDIIALESTGVLRRLSRAGGEWESAQIGAWQGLNRAAPGSHRLFAADLDNNGGLDLVAAGAGESRIWLSDEQHQLTGLQATPAGEVFSVADLNADGTMDLLATAATGAVRHLGRGQAAYHWKEIRARAQQNAGDQRINAFGVGGELEVRSGLLLQKHVLTGAPVHVGLGIHTTIDVARIVWPNGVAQAEFGAGVDDVFVAEQRLKGSCPWVFTWDGERMRFVTDFLWRSPLGLRINAQDTAGVGQTEDWVRISGTELVPRHGSYDVRITAELWETHFFDHVSLMLVDRPEGTDVFVDERFSAAHPPAYAVHAVRTPRAVARARDQRGRDVTDLIAREDGRYLASFERGRYQGIASGDHFVDLEIGEREARSDRRVLLANGWIYPTDSSINVAIGQGGHVQPRGLSVEVEQADGRWTVLHEDLGFPAGKNKTVVVDLSGAPEATRVRLRTNLEISWDWIAVAAKTDASLRTARVGLAGAELRYRGFSETSSPRGDAPETPDYERIASTGQRWRDLAGFHTRFGDVRELLATVDDRYVIMNAGDELRLLFPEQAAPPPGWRRDFVLIGDGWEKDGDYNTGYSQTVLPLPSHDNPAYRAGAESPALEDDPVYRRHQDDWQRYHTRYVAPDAFVSGLAHR